MVVVKNFGRLQSQEDLVTMSQSSGVTTVSQEVTTTEASTSVIASQHETVSLLLQQGSDDVNLGQFGIGEVQCVQLPDGSTAYIHNKDSNAALQIEEDTVMEDEAVRIEHESNVQEIHTEGHAIDESQAQNQEVPEHEEEKFEGQVVQLEDGSTAFIQQAPKGSLQAVQLEDGSTAYISHSDHYQENENMIGLENISIITKVVNNEEKESPNRSNKELIQDTGIVSKGKLVCSVRGCGKAYSTHHHLKVHERTHTGDRPFKCDVASCEKSFATGYGLKSHIRVHTGEKPYKCPDDSCRKAFKTSGDLQKHVRTHTGERPFKCPFEGCNRAFTTSNIRKVHIRTHTGERPYMCQAPDCHRTFASATNYKNHVRIHSGEKPYVCTVDGCNKRFTEYSSLYKHHVVHTHTKPYMCQQCGKNYRQTSTLSMHKRTVHGILTDDILAIDIPRDRRQRVTTYSMPHMSDNEAESEGPLVINTADNQRMTMVTQEQALVALQATQQAAQLAIDQIQASSNDANGQQIFVIASDPSQIEAFQNQIHQYHTEDGSLVEVHTTDPGKAAPNTVAVSVAPFTSTSTSDSL